MSNEDPPVPGPRRERNWMLILTAAGVVVAVVGVLVALGDWRLPVTDAGVTPPSSRSTVRPPVPPPDPTSSPTTDGTALTALEIKSGGANVKPLPRAIAANPAYAGGLAIGCPTNQSDDKTRSVVFVLRQRYLDLDTTVRPYFPDDPADRVKVTAVAGVKQRDGSIATEVRAGYTGATGAAGRIAAAFEDAEELTLTVECESADGLAVLRGTVTRAA